VTVNGTLAEHFEYDGNGNRTLGYSDAKRLTYTGVYDDQDRLLSYGPWAFTYGANGELESKTNTDTDDTWPLQYVLGNLLSVRLPNGDLVDYLVDGVGRRVGKKRNGALIKQWIYRDALKPMAELDAVSRIIMAVSKQRECTATCNVDNLGIRVTGSGKGLERERPRAVPRSRMPTVDTVELTFAVGDDEIQLRVEILECIEPKGCYTARLWRSSTSIQPTFPHAGGEPTHEASDELILKEFEGFESPLPAPRAFPGLMAARDYVLQELAVWLGTQVGINRDG
jgi:hypothetical protein